MIEKEKIPKEEAKMMEEMSEIEKQIVAKREKEVA